MRVIVLVERLFVDYIVGDWSLGVGDGRHNHDMVDVLKGHKISGRLNPNERLHLHEKAESDVPLR